jgi:flagellar basal body-associated protein FliL
MKKKVIIILVIILIILLAGTALILLRGDEDTWICNNGQWVKHGNPSAVQPSAGQCLPQD